MELGPDEFVTTFTETFEHEKQVNAQFDALKAERDQAFELLGQLTSGIAEVLAQLSPPLYASPSDVRVAMEKLQAVIRDVAPVPPSSV